MNWTEEELAKLPLRRGFRQRGEAMTRIEIFSDAAFAFAVTMLVISLSAIPKNYSELIYALKGVPAFLASFALVMLFWAAHRRWSRQFGLDDMPTTVLTLGLIFVVLVYVYPLKLMMTTLFTFISGGYFPSEFQITSAEQMAGLVCVYGLGVFLLSIIFTLLYGRSLALRERLCLNELEITSTRSEVYIWGTYALVALISVFWGWLMPVKLAIHGGFVYFLLPVAIPIISMHFGKQIRALPNRHHTEPESD